jgi:hypothetical protein
VTTTRPRPVDDAGVEQLRVRPLGRRVHVPMVLVGLLLVVGCALAFGVLAQRLADQRPVLVLARPLDRGTVLTSADLAIAQVSADPALRTVAPQDRGRLVGNTLRIPLRGGALVTPEVVAPGAVDLGPQARTVGLALEPGEYPVASLAAGDTVSVVATAGDGSVLDDDGVVLAVEPAIEGSATLLVSVVVDVGAAAPITAAAAVDQVRLVLHGAGR